MVVQTGNLLPESQNTRTVSIPTVFIEQDCTHPCQSHFSQQWLFVTVDIVTQKTDKSFFQKVNSNIYETNLNSFQNTKTQFCRYVFFCLSHIEFFTAPSPNFTLVLFLLFAMFVPGDIKHASHYLGVRLMFSRLKEEKEEWIPCYLGFQCIWKWSCWFLVLGRKQRRCQLWATGA